MSLYKYLSTLSLCQLTDVITKASLWQTCFIWHNWPNWVFVSRTPLIKICLQPVYHFCGAHALLQGDLLENFVTDVSWILLQSIIISSSFNHHLFSIHAVHQNFIENNRFNQVTLFFHHYLISVCFWSIQVVNSWIS